MGQQQLLLIVLGTIIVGVAVVVGINMFAQGAANAERDAMLQDINSIAADGAAYWRKPAAMGGGNRVFTGATLGDFGSADTTANATYTITIVDTENYTINGTGLNEGVTITAQIDQTGVQSTSITMP
jgi:hypothetical protein